MTSDRFVDSAPKLDDAASSLSANDVYEPPKAPASDTAGGVLNPPLDHDPDPPRYDANTPGGIHGLLSEINQLRRTLPRQERMPGLEQNLVAERVDSSFGGLSKDHPSPLTLAAAFDSLRRDVGVDLTKPGTWEPTNPEQQYMADRLPSAVESLSSLPSGVEVKGKASKEVGPVNDFLKQQGFNIELKDQQDPTSLYLAGTLEVKDDWDAKAKKMVANDGKTYDSVYKTGQVFNIDGQDVAEIHSNDEKGIKVYAIPVPEDMPGYQVNERAEEIIAKLQGAAGRESKVEFPMVDLNTQGQIDGLIGLGVKGSDLEISQAMIQNIVKMDETGFQAKQAAAIGMIERSIPRPDPAAFQIKDKFIFAVATTDGKFVFATHIGQEHWNRPDKSS